MTIVLERLVRVHRREVSALEPVIRLPDPPRRARTVGLSELLGRRPDLRGVHPPADIAAESVLWSA
jgi:hypothetical protein